MRGPCQTRSVFWGQQPMQMLEMIETIENGRSTPATAGGGCVSSLDLDCGDIQAVAETMLAAGRDGAAAQRQRLEHSLCLLEEMQEQFRRGREALAPYLDVACAAYQRLETVGPSSSMDDEERQRILESCEALERLMRMWEKSRGYVETCVTAS